MAKLHRETSFKSKMYVHVFFKKGRLLLLLLLLCEIKIKKHLRKNGKWFISQKNKQNNK